MRTPFRLSGKRDGIALILVLGVGLVVLAIGMAMITTSGGLLQNTVDAKQRIRARYAAEGMIAIQIARSVEKASEYFGRGLSSESIDWTDLNSAGGEEAKAEIINQVVAGATLAQEKIQTGRMKGLMGLKIPIRVTSTSRAGSRAKQEIDADVRLYQVPIFQFGVFYEGNLEVAPGSDMYLLGPVHTNSNAYFRGFSGRSTMFWGPVTASGTIYHWNQSSGKIRYYNAPDTGLFLEPALGTAMTTLTNGTRPQAMNGVYNIRDNQEKLILPIGGAIPRNLLALRDSSDVESLRKQKFDRMVPVNGANRWVNGQSPSRAWITGPKVFYNRREARWVKFWDFNVGLYAAMGGTDSIFYLADTICMPRDHGVTRDTLINAFRIVNARYLPRNMTIATPNPIYILGNFNLARAGGPCSPRDYVGTVPDSLKYCNAQIAADNITFIDSASWMASRFSNRNLAADDTDKYTMRGTLEWPDTTAARWTTSRVSSSGTYISSFSEISNLTPYADTVPVGTLMRVNAALLTGNKPSRISALPPATTTDGDFNSNYEGGLHNAVRYLEELSLRSIQTTFKGSFVCIWAADARGLDKDTTGKPVIYRRNHYKPPDRLFAFDPRFKSLNNMPPGTPFLATAIFTNWVERQ